MKKVTCFVAMAFARSDDGDLVPGEAKELQTAGAAVREEQKLATTAAGAVAFSPDR